MNVYSVAEVGGVEVWARPPVVVDIHARHPNVSVFADLRAVANQYATVRCAVNLEVSEIDMMGVVHNYPLEAPCTVHNESLKRDVVTRCGPTGADPS